MFLQGILTQRGAFAMAMNVSDADVHARFVFDDGSSITLRDFKTVGPFAGSDWGMLLGREADAYVVRESGIARVYFQLAGERADRIGFDAESAKA